ncbi:MAG: DUF4270 domain-containing protein [Bacteroidales bacterium]|nr:DUF4270 domain-containing protein [Bacteroidales bacterium]
MVIAQPLRKKSRLIILSLFLVSIFFASCKKEPNEIGLNLQPGSDKMELFSDTLYVETYTVLDNNIASDERSISPIGSYIDPMFGFVKSDFFTHLRLSAANVDFSKEANSVDSLVLHLNCVGHYGNQSNTQKIKIYRVLNKDIYTDSIYYSDYKFEANDLQELASKEFNNWAKDTTLSIKMPQTLIDEFTNSSNTSNFVSNETFIKYFKGLYVTSEDVTNDGAIYYIDLLSKASKMTLYYNDTLSFDFLINASCARINMFEHDYTLADASINQAIGDTSQPNAISYMQSLGGLKIKLFIKGLEKYDNENIAINKAEIQIPINSNINDELNPPSNLSLIAINAENKNEFLTDYKINSKYFGGGLNKSENSYNFNIPFHIQQLISTPQLREKGLYLFPLDNRTSAGRVAVNGGNHNSNPIKIIVLYSKF